MARMAGKNTVPDHLRCVYVRGNGKRCGQPRDDPGSERNMWCGYHTVMIGKQAVVKQTLGSNPVLSTNPIEALVEEIQRSQLMVRWYQHLLDELDPEDALLVRITESRTGGPGGDYELVREEQRPHPVLVLLRDERAHLANCSRMAIQSGIEAKQLELSQTMAATVITAMTSLARKLGLDPSTQDVRRMIAEAMREARDGEALALTAGHEGAHGEGEASGQEAGV